MPTEQPSQQLEWTEENLCNVLKQINFEAATNQEFYKKVMAEPYEVLNQRIKVPDQFNRQVFARPANKMMFIMSVPAYNPLNDVATYQPNEADYQLLCTAKPW